MAENQNWGLDNRMENQGQLTWKETPIEPYEEMVTM